MFIPFYKPRRVLNEINFIEKVLSKGNTVGGGEESSWCSFWLEENLNANKVLLTNSATDALEMAALLLNIRPGDEIIMPSYTFSSSANAFVLRGAIPVFVDVEPNTMNIDPNNIESAITENTKAVLVVHYAGISCELEVILQICKKYNLRLIEDAAQGLMSKYNDKYLGTFGDLACISFHATKNVVSGEGGALIINDFELVERAKILLEKGTNRDQFVNGQVDKYTWVDVGSSYLPSEITAAYLRSQLEKSSEITEYRLNNWNYYMDEFTNYGHDLGIQTIKPPKGSQHNAHIFFLILRSELNRTTFIKEMASNEISCNSHYVPLHSSIAGKKFGGVGSQMLVTDTFASRLVRLPMWSHEDMPIEYIANKAIETLKKINLYE
jgi:dTDP-4-amino-4,6-dideoxygalactose transaminase